MMASGVVSSLDCEGSIMSLAFAGVSFFDGLISCHFGTALGSDFGRVA